MFMVMNILLLICIPHVWKNKLNYSNKFGMLREELGQQYS